MLSVNAPTAQIDLGRPTKVHIRTEYLKHNVRLAMAKAPSSELLGMVKANAYGHGLVGISRVLDEMNVPALGVASINEALQLRKAGISCEIVLMEGCFSKDELQVVEQYHLTLIVHHFYQIEFLEQYASTLKIPVWLKVNIGMNRLGVPPISVLSCYERLICLPHVEWVGCMGHFSDTDATEDPKTLRQMALFMEACGDIPGKKSLANSGGVLSWPISHLERVRPGIMLYGVSPFLGQCGEDLGLKPVMEFSSQVITIQEVMPGETVGYGSIWRACRKSRIGVVAAGYGDGYPKHAPTGTPVWVAGKVVPLVGRVSMDMLTVDLSEHPGAIIGSKVVLWGSELPVEQVAHAIGTTSPYELLCGIAPRVPVGFI